MSDSSDNCPCPLCDLTHETTRVYQHLQTSHRKSTLSRRLLEETHEESKELLGATIQASTTHPTIETEPSDDR
jgi:hypothetical protein